MPTIYLSPSIQPYNKYLTEGDEQYWMNRIADDMVPMLEQNGINVVRNTPNTSLGQAIRESNAGNYDLHLALHSNAGRQIWREAARAGCVLLSVQRFRQARGGAYCR